MHFQMPADARPVKAAEIAFVDGAEEWVMAIVREVLNKMLQHVTDGATMR